MNLQISFEYVPVGFESGLSLGILSDNIGHESGQTLVETNLQALVLGNLDLDLALHVTIGLSTATVLSSLQLLMSEPNPDDGLMVDITAQYINDHARFERTAIEVRRLHRQSTRDKES